MKTASLLLTLTLAFVGGFYMVGCAAFGTRPGKDYQEKFSQSPNYDKNEKAFVNRQQEAIKEMRKRAMSFSTLKEWFSKGENRTPAHPLPEVKPDLAEFLKPSDHLKTIWFGHSTFLLNMDGKIILVDPVFSGSAAPFSFMVKRFQKTVLDLHDLPEIDYIVISHDHYDHLDMTSIQFFKDKKARFLTPLGVSSHLIGWGIESSRITELDWWQSHKVDGIEFVATPAQHFSGRTGLRDNETLWASWVLRNDKHNIYFSGDSGYDIHFKEIGEKYGPFDIAFIECGQYNEKWKEVHMLPEESMQAYADLKAKRFFPVHWGMFVLAFHAWNDPILKLQEASTSKGINLVTPRLGQIVVVNDDYKNEAWW
ncbi:MBL fold metallo-hydrolase [Bdellovibrio bacteriovorus]|uniref:MBL fold metallo-hydrolase n=1 Tax=Bdellovibrio bacteriovorus TaxID=959 RepID=UPI0035A73762